MLTKLRAEIKDGMLNKNTIKRDLFKLVLNKAQAIAKEQKCEINDDIVIKAGNSELKQLNQTLELTPEGTDFYKENLVKKQILVDFLPKMLSEEEIREKVIGYLGELAIDWKNKGIVMKTLMPRFKGIADGKLVNKIISEVVGNYSK